MVVVVVAVMVLVDAVVAAVVSQAATVAIVEMAVVKALSPWMAAAGICWYLGHRLLKNYHVDLVLKKYF